jgi:hypothetical protein
MEKDLKNICNGGARVYLERLQAVFCAMDREYKDNAAQYGFKCDGCKDNCCKTHFYHHTHIEVLYLTEGFKTLSSENQMVVKSRAEDICRQPEIARESKKPSQIICPLNFNNLCILYRYRPMICRLHGIPHELQKNSGRKIYGPGCATFDARCADRAYIKFDRTPFYFELAALESEFRQAAGISEKIKVTIAEMLAGKVQIAKCKT